MATPLTGLQHLEGKGEVALLSNSANKVDSSSPSTSVSYGVLNYSELESPTLIFLLFHKAIRNELDALHRLAMAFATGSRSDIQPLFERYHFVRSIYRRHCNAEDEMQILDSLFTFCVLILVLHSQLVEPAYFHEAIFPALDNRVKNVVQTYSLEHKGESNLFDHLFELLNSTIQNDESFSKELASCTGALQTSVNQHKAKEEEQVLPLARKHFSFKNEFLNSSFLVI